MSQLREFVTKELEFELSGARRKLLGVRKKIVFTAQ